MSPWITIGIAIGMSLLGWLMFRHMPGPTKQHVGWVGDQPVYKADYSEYGCQGCVALVLILGSPVVLLFGGLAYIIPDFWNSPWTVPGLVLAILLVVWPFLINKLKVL